jgi:ATP synthase F1 delta subunit
MSNQAKIAKIVDPYAEALIAFRINPQTVLSVLDILHVYQDHFLNPRVPTAFKKSIINVLQGTYNPFLLRLCLLILDKEKPELLCPILERYIVLCNSIDRVKAMKVTSTVPLNKTQKKLLVARLTQLTQSKKILLTNVVDSRIFGGVVIETSTNVVNINIKDRLKTILSYLY